MLKLTEFGNILIEVILAITILSIVIGPLVSFQAKYLRQRNIVNQKFDISNQQLKSCNIKTTTYSRVIICEEENFPKLKRFIFY